MDNRVKETWGKLHEGIHEGKAKRLYDAEALYRMYCIYDASQNIYGVAISYSNTVKINTSPFERLEHIKVKIGNDSSFDNSNILYVYMLETKEIALYDIFAELCDNILTYVKSMTTEKLAVIAFVNQLAKWETLFNRLKSGGLSREQQQGLFGELYLLCDLIQNIKKSYELIMDAWVGPDSNTQDFQSVDWAIEVKTSVSSNPQTVRINNEKQLDERLQKNLYLCHLSMQAGSGSGETLIDKVCQIRELLNNNVPALVKFNVKLNEIGYFEKDKNLYVHTRYTLRKNTFYKIDTNFPRIREDELREGVGNVNYSISLSFCDTNIVSQQKVFEIISALLK